MIYYFLYFEAIVFDSLDAFFRKQSAYFWLKIFQDIFHDYLSIHIYRFDLTHLKVSSRYRHILYNTAFHS